MLEIGSHVSKHHFIEWFGNIVTFKENTLRTHMEFALFVSRKIEKEKVLGFGLIMIDNAELD